jgi:hypothetical protein
LFINKSLTKADIDLLLGTMKKIHESESTVTQGIEMYDNYWRKLWKRYDENIVLYRRCAGLGGDVDAVLVPLKDKLQRYERESGGIGGVIHGDMVFSNIFLCEPRLLKFIDMRGKVGDTLTIYGDIFYDYAKVYQSLCGYDYVLMGREHGMSEYNAELLRYFEEKFTAQWGAERMGWIKIITASFFFSLIPLHTDLGKQKLYFKLCQSLL